VSVRRLFAALLVVSIAGAGGAVAYTAYTTAREYDALIAAGDRALAADQLFQALESFSGAIVLRPDSMLAYLKRGMTYRKAGELDAAMRDLRRASELDPSATWPLELLGDVNLAQQRYDRAAERYEAYLRVDDRSARVEYKLGLARYRTGQLGAATEALQRAIALDGSASEAYFLLGLCRREQGNAPAARAALETATKLAPGVTSAREALASVYAMAGDTAHTIDQLEALAALEPTRAERFVAVGLAHARAGRHDAAVIALSRAVERFPDVPQAYAALGHVWLEMAERRGDHVALGKALEALTAATRHSDAGSGAFTDLGRAWMLSGDRITAERALREALRQMPVEPTAYLHLANITAREGQTQEARDSLVRYATLVGDREPLAGIAAQIADYSMKLGEPHLALRWLDRALDEAGPTAVLLARLAEAAWQAGDHERARTAVREGLALSPGDPTLLALRRRIALRD
jgi:tetratricopeptide (TPR) repeat protein